MSVYNQSLPRAWPLSWLINAAVYWLVAGNSRAWKSSRRDNRAAATDQPTAADTAQATTIGQQLVE